MKKTVKSLIIAASVAAIAGIGAVSFAAWSGSSDKDVAGTLESGTVVAVGFADSSEIADNTKKLMPFDQASITEASETYYYTATLVTSGTDFTGYKIKVTAAAVGESAIPSGLKVALLESAPEAGTGKTLPTATWLSLSDGNAKELVASGITDNKTYTAYIVMESNNDNYADNAGKNFTVTFELTNA